jgi:hypothetical protein
VSEAGSGIRRRQEAKVTEGLETDNVIRTSCSRYIFRISKSNVMHRLYVILEMDNVVEK